MSPYKRDTRSSYVERCAENHLHTAKVHHKFRNKASMWLQLLYWAMADDVYGAHWDDLMKRGLK